MHIHIYISIDVSIYVSIQYCNGSSNSIFDVDDDCVDIHNYSCNDIIISEN